MTLHCSGSSTRRSAPERTHRRTFDSGQTMFTALQDQLGLKLDPGRESVEVLVIDRVEMPAPD